MPKEMKKLESPIDRMNYYASRFWAVVSVVATICTLLGISIKDIPLDHSGPAWWQFIAGVLQSKTPTWSLLASIAIAALFACLFYREQRRRHAIVSTQEKGDKTASPHLIREVGRVYPEPTQNDWTVGFISKLRIRARWQWINSRARNAKPLCPKCSHVLNYLHQGQVVAVSNGPITLECPQSKKHLKREFLGSTSDLLIKLEAEIERLYDSGEWKACFKDEQARQSSVERQANE